MAFRRSGTLEEVEAQSPGLRGASNPGNTAQKHFPTSKRLWHRRRHATSTLRRLPASRLFHQRTPAVPLSNSFIFHSFLSAFPFRTPLWVFMRWLLGIPTINFGNVTATASFPINTELQPGVPSAVKIPQPF
jgi:hypothetical protein